MSNRWQAFQEEEQVEIPKTTSNPLRKIKKKIRQKQEKYDKNPSPELYNELLKLKNHLKIFLCEPVKKQKKKKFKKKKVNKAEVANEKKRKKEKELKERFNAEYNRWKQEQYEKNRKRLEDEKRRRMYEEQQVQLEKMRFINITLFFICSTAWSCSYLFTLSIISIIDCSRLILSMGRTRRGGFISSCIKCNNTFNNDIKNIQNAIIPNIT